MPRIRDLGIYRSPLNTGTHNAITDVAGVSVGHCTIIEGEGSWQGDGPYRTGVTVIMPHQGNLYQEKVSAAVYTLNGFGKYAGFEQVRELGSIETPIALTSTLNMPRVADALISYAIEQSPHIGVGFKETGFKGYASVNPVVGECADGFLNDAQSRRVGDKEVREALAAAHSGVVDEGSRVAARVLTVSPFAPARSCRFLCTVGVSQVVMGFLGIAFLWRAGSFLVRAELGRGYLCQAGGLRVLVSRLARALILPTASFAAYSVC